MKMSLLRLGVIALLAMGSSVSGQSLQEVWAYSFDETDAGKQIDFIAPLNAGSDGSVAFVVTRSDGGGRNQENQIFWLRPDSNGNSPTAPIWSSGWQPSDGFIDIVAVRRNHLVFSTGRLLRSVTLDGSAATVATVKVFTGAQEGGDPLVYNFEQARAPGFVFALASQEDKDGFTLSAFRFTPAPPAISAVPTFTTITGDSLSLSFQTSLGVNYQLQSSATLTATSWNLVGLPIAGNGEIQTLVQSVGAPQLFFRVVAL